MPDIGIKKLLLSKKIRRVLADSWSVSWPMTLIMFLIFIMGITDVFVAGKFGKEIQAAYGVSFQIYFILLIIAMALTVGSVAVISRLFTSGDRRRYKRAVNSSLSTIFLAGCLFSALGVTCSGLFIGFLSIPEALKDLAKIFLSIYSVGILFHYLMINTNAILRASNSIKRSLATMSLVSLLNVGLNLLLSFHTPLGFQGIAISTVISLFIGTLLNLSHVYKLTKGLKFTLSETSEILRISWPAGALQIFWQTGTMVLYMIISSLPYNNVETIAAYTNGLKIESAIFLPAFAFNMANAVVVGNLLGKNKKNDAFFSGIITAITGVIIVILLTIFVMAGSRVIASSLSDNHIVIHESVKYILIVFLFEPIMTWGVILGGGLNGAGDTKTVMTIAAISIWLIRVPLAYTLGIQLGLGAIGIWWAMNLSIIVHTSLITMRYFRKQWMSLPVYGRS